MHGRLKVKTSAQIEAEQLAKKQKKLKYFQSIVKQIFELRVKLKNGSTIIHENGETIDEVNEYENEKKEKVFLPLLRLTGEVLINNPDIATFWNIRREILLEIKQDYRISEKDEEIELDKHWKAELDLTMTSLTTSPKSYGIWHHRSWTMLQNAQPDWGKELELCSMYLKVDERNFHCWDYRRFVVLHSTTIENSMETELNFSFDKIQNISNYSAWHYRSKLLPVVHPSKTSIGINESKRREELQLVENAIYTDPSDSSAWFYYRWLLSSCGSSDESKHPQLQIIKRQSDNKLMVATSTSLNVKDLSSLKLFTHNEEVINPLDNTWKSITGQKSDTLWISNDEVPSNFNITLNGCDHVMLKSDDVLLCEYSGSDTIPDSQTLELLQQEKETLKELIELNESAVGSQAASDEEKKWTKLNLALVTKKIDQSPECVDTIAEMFSELENIDCKRKGYYADQRSRFIIENQLKSETFSITSCANLSNRGLSCIYYHQYFSLVKELDLSSNRIRSVDGFLPYLIECESLILDDNLIDNLQHNGGTEHKSSEKLLGGQKLKRLSLKRNPIAQDKDMIAKIQDSTLNKIVIF